MFSSYVKACHRSPAIVVSYLEQSSGFIHSCHFVLKDMSLDWVIEVLLVTYSETGVRLSCSEFEGRRIVFLNGTYLQNGISRFVEQHFRVGYLS